LTYLQINRDTFLELAPATAERPVGLSHVGLWADNLNAEVAALRQQGVKVDDPRTATTKAPLTNVIDPNGIRLELLDIAQGSMQRKAIDSWPSDKTVAVFGSGGMSHFVIDEQFDRAFVEALAKKDRDYLTSIPLADLQSGTSELKSWITLAGVLDDVGCTMREIDYVPCYRSAAGTGTANGFYWWEIER